MDSWQKTRGMSINNVQICVACVYGLGLRLHASLKQKYNFTWSHVKQCKDISLWRGCEEEGMGGIQNTFGDGTIKVTHCKQNLKDICALWCATINSID
jgi:hypothetical protein